MAQIKSYTDILSDDTKKEKDELKSYEKNPYGDYKQSNEVTKAYQNWQNTQKNKPGEYQSQYSGEISKLLDEIVNGKGFSYDFNADPIYQQYKDQYTALGNQAMMDTTANAATLTGGYGNSYATTAGSQAYQGYLQQLNNVVPELYQAALDKYNADRENTYNQFSALGAQEDRAYGQYQDKYQNWQNDVSNAMSAYSLLHDQDFAKYQQNMSNWQNDRNYYADKYNNAVANDQWAANYNQTDAENQRAADQWAQEFAYQKERDAVSDNQWAQEFALQKLAASRSGSSGGRGSSKDSEETEIKEGQSSTGSGANLSAVAKVTNQLKTNPQSGGGDYQEYLADMVSKGEISREEAQEILEQVNLGKVKTPQKLYVN